MRHSLIPMYREMHDAGHFGGRTIYGHADTIVRLVKGSRAKSLLDYGSGKGRQYVEGRIHELWGGIMPTLYDPAVAKHSRRPKVQFDGVICTDVLEHIPEEELDETLADIRQFARQWAFVSVACWPAKKTLPDGRNVHVNVQTQDWWMDKLAKAFDAGPELHVEFSRKTEGKPETRVKQGLQMRNREKWISQKPWTKAEKFGWPTEEVEE